MQPLETIPRLGEKVAALLPDIASRADEIEAAGRMPLDIADDLAAAGVYAMVTPKSFGGFELSPPEIVAVLHAISRSEASTGWCAMIGATTAVNAAYLPRDIAQSIYGNPLIKTGGVFAPMGRAEDMGDHYRVSGRWQWGSGNVNCDWLCAGAMIFKDGELQRMDNGAPYHRMMYFASDQVERLDTWHVVGMKGTGSSDFTVKDAIIPKEQSVSLITDTPHEEGALYTYPVFGLLAMGVASVALGNAAGALDEIKALVAAKKPIGGQKAMAEKPVIQTEIARAEAQYRAAEAFFREAVAKCWTSAQANGHLGPHERAELRLAATYATESAADVAKTAFTLGGGNAVYLTCNLQRRFRDAHVATQHIATSAAIYELTGRVLLDLPTDMAML
ncbi:acyl-CoA dehydrogenase family protein [Parasphingorhabdus sp. DH2-15]|uniref:acyl-CoA dehydrogenase family protein n=1 Tax=Parasphingorhabdus sp. DH2-15 TaxID=3444112 RepID=UPI003F6876F4